MDREVHVGRGGALIDLTCMKGCQREGTGHGGTRYMRNSRDEIFSKFTGRRLLVPSRPAVPWFRPVPLTSLFSPHFRKYVKNSSEFLHEFYAEPANEMLLPNFLYIAQF